MRVCVRLYTHNRASTSSCCTGAICEETSFFKHKYNFLRSASAQRQEALLKYLLQIAKRSHQNTAAEAQTKDKNMVWLNENTHLLNKFSFDLPRF